MSTAEADRWIRLFRERRFLVGLLIAAAFVVVSVLVPQFFTFGNFVNVIVQACPIGLMAIGLTFVFVTGGMDLSQPAVMSMAAVVGSLCMKGTGSIALGIIVIVAVGLGVGLCNGFAVACLGMIPFVVTLSIMVVSGGATVWMTNAESVYGLPSAFISILTHRIFSIPVPVLILVLFGLLAHYVLGKTLYGRWVFAVGINAKAAQVSGIRTTGTTLSVYMLSGLFAGLAAVITTARLGSASAAMGTDAVVLDVISSAVIGGVSIYGGAGTILGAVIGAIFITIISNIMNLLGISYYTTLAIKGLIIILATALNIQHRGQER